MGSANQIPKKRRGKEAPIRISTPKPASEMAGKAGKSGRATGVRLDAQLRSLQAECRGLNHQLGCHLESATSILRCLLPSPRTGKWATRRVGWRLAWNQLHPPLGCPLSSRGTRGRVWRPSPPDKNEFLFFKNKPTKLLKTQARCPESDKTIPISNTQPSREERGDGKGERAGQPTSSAEPAFVPAGSCPHAKVVGRGPTKQVRLSLGDRANPIAGRVQPEITGKPGGKTNPSQATQPLGRRGPENDAWL
jgi:hypothetical protein